MVKIRKNVENMEIYDYMKELNENVWCYFFDDSLAHETIYHSLNELEQIIISRLLFIQQVVSERAMRLWINPNYLKKLSESIKNLVEAKILVESDMKKDNYNQYKINESFRITLLNKIYKTNTNNIFIFNNNIKEQLEREKNLYEQNLFPHKEEIFGYAQTKWNNLLHFIASPNFNSVNNYFNSNINNDDPNKYSSYDMTRRKRAGKDGGSDLGRKSFDKMASRRSYNRRRKKKRYSDEEDEFDEEEYEGEDYDNSVDGDDNDDDGDDSDGDDNDDDDDDDDDGDDNDDNGDDNDDNGDDNSDDHNDEENSHPLVKYQYENHQLNNSTPYVEKPSDDYTYKKEDENKIGQRKSVHFNTDLYEEQYNNSYTQQIDSNNVNEMDYYMNDSKTKNNKKKKKKNKHIYAYKQNELYYKSLLNMEHSYIEEENYNNNESAFFLSNMNERFMTKPSESVIEVLRRKNFLLDDPNNTKTINMSREAFSWFLKDLRSRIISLVLEYLLIIDNGYVTNIAKDVYTKYQKKKNNATNNITASSSSGINNNINYDENIKSNNAEESKKNYDNNSTTTTTTTNNNNNNSTSSSSAYITRSNKDPKKSEIYVKETLLLILSLSQCDISHPIFLDNLTKAQKEFIDFGSHIGLFLKPNDTYIFITPYALLLTINNFNSQYYLSLLSNITIEGLCEEDVRKRLSERYFHFYLLKQDEKEEKYINKDLSSDIKNKDDMSLVLDKRKNITKKLINDSLYSDIKMNGSNNLEIGLIVQSNFKVYLYTSSLLKINILSHLCELQARTPNMVVGILTRRSVLNAYNSDITANQIIKFLESYSHPGKNNFKSSIPMNVITQLKLWESERHRLTLEDAIVFKSFEKDFMPHLYQQIVIWANSKNYLLYYTPWPKNNTKEFDIWIKAEKYLCCIYESKNEIIDKIKEIREKLMKKRQSG